MKTMNRLFAALLLAPLAGMLIAAKALAAEEGYRLDRAPIDPRDLVSLQSGARTFANYCLSCHSAKYMRYNRLEDLGLTPQEIQDNLMFASDKIGHTMTVAMTEAQGKRWFGVAPPDLTLEARYRGVDWIYTYLKSFYRDPSRPTGWNNHVFFIGGVQVDRFGNTNLIGIGPDCLYAQRIAGPHCGCALNALDFRRSVFDLDDVGVYLLVLQNRLCLDRISARCFRCLELTC